METPKRIAGFLERKEALQSQLAQIEAQLAAYESGAPAPGSAPVAKAKPGRTAAPAKAAAAAPQRFISDAGRERIAAAQRERWARQKAVAAKPTPSAPAAKPAAKPVEVKAPAPKAPVASKKGGRARPGEFKDSIVALVKAAGKPGITVKDAAAKLGVKTQRVYVWFGATGKTIKQIKKVAPATYAWV